MGEQSISSPIKKLLYIGLFIVPFLIAMALIFWAKGLGTLPIMDMNGKFVQMKYKNPPVSKDVVVFENQIDFSEPLILCEGVFDAMSVKSNSIPLFGKTILPKLYKKIVEKKVKDIFIILDSDAFDDAIRMTEKFVNEGINVNFVKLDGQDPNDLGYKKMITKINNSLPMDFKQIMEMKLYGKKLLAN